MYLPRISLRSIRATDYVAVMKTIDPRDKFELRRQSDELVYTFFRVTRSDQTVAYKRQDGDYWIVQRPGWGWVAWDEASQSCTGRPWNVLPHDQGDYPPEGEWVSRKGSKSYVYSLVCVT
jgi:hypothetical protein